jgi:hypothetical protein
VPHVGDLGIPNLRDAKCSASSVRKRREDKEATTMERGFCDNTKEKEGVDSKGKVFLCHVLQRDG